MIVRQPGPAGEIAALEDEVNAVIEDMTARFRVLLDAAFKARVDGEPVTDKWTDLDIALRNFAFPAALEVAESIAAYIDREQEELLAAIAPAEGARLPERLVWQAPRISDVPDVQDHRDGKYIEALVYATEDRQWRVTMVSYAGTAGERFVHGQSRLVRFAVAHALGMSPSAPPVAAVEREVLAAARKLAEKCCPTFDERCPSCGAAVDEGCRRGAGSTGDPLTSCG